MKRFSFNRQKAKPEDFYFHAGYSPEDDQYIVVINPIKYWNRYGYVYDQHLSIEHILPDYMSECQESHFETSKGLKQTVADLKKLGFQENKEFSKFCQNHNPFC